MVVKISDITWKEWILLVVLAVLGSAVFGLLGGVFGALIAHYLYQQHRKGR